MIVLGLILIIAGWIVGLGALESLGLLLVIVGLILNVVPIRGERHRYW